MVDRNRTIDNTGVRLDGTLLDLDVPTGLSVTTAQATGVSAPLKTFIDSLPYYLDEQGKLAYKSATIAINHSPVKLKYKAPHPLAGSPIVAQYNDGAYATMRGGAPMPFIDLDMIGPTALEKFLGVLNEIYEAQVSAT